MTIPTKRAEAVKDRAAAGLMAKPGVLGVGVTALGGRAAILILVSRLTPDLASALPKAIEGHPVVIEEVGQIQAR